MAKKIDPTEQEIDNLKTWLADPVRHRKDLDALLSERTSRVAQARNELNEATDELLNTIHSIQMATTRMALDAAQKQ